MFIDIETINSIVTAMKMVEDSRDEGDFEEDRCRVSIQALDNLKKKIGNLACETITQKEKDAIEVFGLKYVQRLPKDFAFALQEIIRLKKAFPETSIYLIADKVCSDRLMPIPLAELAILLVEKCRHDVLLTWCYDVEHNTWKSFARRLIDTYKYFKENPDLSIDLSEIKRQISAFGKPYEDEIHNL